jgi:hypothetical protein
MIAIVATLLLALALEPLAPDAAGPPVLALAGTGLVLGIDQDTELRVEVPEETSAPPRLVTSAGHVDDLVRTGPRTFVGRYVLPGERFPQVAILVAEVPGHPRGLLVVPLRAAASPAFRTDPGAAVTLRIGEREFGPQKAQKDGTVRIPVVVPPGVLFGVARSTNQFGETTEQTIDLKIPPFRRLLAVAPDTLVAGAMGELAIYAVDGAGLPVDSSQVVVTSPTGKAQPLGGQPGEARFLVRAPPLVATGALHLKAGLRNDRDVAIPVDIPVVAGPPAHLVLRADRARLAVGVGSSMRVYLSAEDQFGNPTDAGRAAVLVDGVALPAHPTEDGRLVAVIPAPARDSARDSVEIEAALGPTYTAQRIPLVHLAGPASAARVYPRLTLTPRLGTVWNFRQPPGAAVSLEALARGERWPDQLLIGLGVGLLSTESDVADSIGISHVDLSQFPVVAIVRLQLRAAARLFVAATIGAGMTFAQGRVLSYGREIRGQALAPTAEAGAEISMRLATGQVVLGLSYMMVSVGKLSSGDQLVGNSAGMILDLGYRLAW